MRALCVNGVHGFSVELEIACAADRSLPESCFSQGDHALHGFHLQPEALPTQTDSAAIFISSIGHIPQRVLFDHLVDRFGAGHAARIRSVGSRYS